MAGIKTIGYKSAAVAAMTAIQIDIHRKTYHAKGAAAAHVAIENLKLSLDAHQFVCLVGQSGCGKTTLLNAIAGLDTDFVGEIHIGQQHSQPKIGYVFQNPRLLPWRTVRENIELALDSSQSTAIVDALLAQMQLADVQQVYPERLSLGMSRRVAIIRAFAINPDVLLMDEPFVSLDAPTVREVRTLLMNLWQQRPHTVLFVTHDLREAIALADKLVLLSPPPMRIVSEVVVPIAREQRDDEGLIESFRQQLFTHYPQIKG
jgi:NitT/TauT family transport system ATP-binding protein